MPPLYVLASGGLAEEVAQLALASDPGVEFRGYVGPGPRDRNLYRGSLLGTDAWLRTFVDDAGANLALGMGSPAVRLKVGAEFSEDEGFSFPNLIHPNAWNAEAIASIGVGNAITSGVVVTVNVAIGSFNLLNLNVTIGHATRIGNGCVLNPGANVSGDVTVGDGVLVGSGATILQGLTIGEGATIGAGAVVTRDVESNATVVGVPAKPLGERATP